MKAKITEGGIWNFHTDTIPEYCYWDGAFTKEECKKIIKLGKDNGLSIAKTRLKGEIAADIRKSKVLWLRCNEDTHWIFHRLNDIVLDINQKYYNFDLWGMHEAIQLTHYNSPGGKYDQHVDKGYQTQIRKLSVCVQLSEPDSYEGGDLIINQGKENKMKRDLGYAVIFPSWTLHKVTAMKKGERWSLVSWIAGPNFR